MELKFALCGLLTAMAMTAGASQPENVVIADAEEVYTFVGGPEFLMVKTVEKAKYEATRHSETIYPHTYYNNKINLDKVSGGKAEYRSVNDPNIFHDDDHICVFEAELKGKGATAKSEFRRTYTDVAHFTVVPLGSVYPVRNKLVKIEIPASCPGIDVVGMNLPAEVVVRNDMTNPNGSRTIMFTVSGMAGQNRDTGAPSALARSPYLLIKGCFKDLAALARFHEEKLDVDTSIPNLDQLLGEIVEDEDSKEVKISKIYKYVQQKIRYVAFEEGEAGYRPDAPAEVLRKHYGDCKGMALLLATMLKGVDIEAYVSAVGTRKIPFKIAEFPSLVATNHMICIVPADGDTLFLDATNKYIAAHDIPFGIQGKDAMLFKDGGFEMVEIPMREPDMSSDETECEYVIEDGRLSGKLVRCFKGDMLEMFKYEVDQLSTPYKNDVIAKGIGPRSNVKVDRESLTGRFVSDGVYELTADFEDKNALTDTGEALYVDLNTDGEPLVSRVDLSDRKSDYELPFRAKIARRSTLKVPDGYSVGELPENFVKDCGSAVFSCEFVKEDDGHVVMVKSAVIKYVSISLSELPGWNKAIADWNEACNHQIELLKK